MREFGIASLRPEPKPVEPAPGEADKKDPVEPSKKDPVDPDMGKKEPIEGKKEPAVGLGDPVQPPIGGREIIGALDVTNVMIDSIAIVLTRGVEPGLPWERVDSKAPEIRCRYPVMALPGYKADVRLKSDVIVHLWGNIPEQVAMKTMVMASPCVSTFRPRRLMRILLLRRDECISAPESRPARKFEFGSRGKPGTSCCRTTSPRSWFRPTRHSYPEPCTRAIHGEKPRTEARLVVVRGTAAFRRRWRFKKFDNLTLWNEIGWDSKSGSLLDLKPIDKDHPLAVRLPLIEGAQGQAIQALLDAAMASLPTGPAFV